MFLAVVFGKFDYKSIYACQDLVFEIVHNKNFINEESIDQLINLLVTLIKLDFIYMNFYETITVRVVWKVLLEFIF